MSNWLSEFAWLPLWTTMASIPHVPGKVFVLLLKLSIFSFEIRIYETWWSSLPERNLDMPEWVRPRFAENCWLNNLCSTDHCWSRQILWSKLPQLSFYSDTGSSFHHFHVPRSQKNIFMTLKLGTLCMEGGTLENMAIFLLISPAAC